MSISRKNFFKQSLYSLGKTTLDLTSLLKGRTEDEASRYTKDCAAAAPRPDMVAAPFNERCLARNCGCFACMERCQGQAIMVVPGTGIRIDEALCSGCGTCEYVCPVTPKAVILQPRTKPVENLH